MSMDAFDEIELLAGLITDDEIEMRLHLLMLLHFGAGVPGLEPGTS
jgi:hypothetical protein